MALKKKKGYNITVLSQENKLWTNAGIFTGFEETKALFNKVVHYLFMLINTDPSGAELSSSKEQWRYYEMLVKGLTTARKNLNNLILYCTR